jgi:hypothetical protein
MLQNQDGAMRQPGTPTLGGSMRPLLLALVPLAACLGASPALAQNRFWLVNQSGLTIKYAYISPSRLTDWGNDILGGTLLATGEQVRITPAAKDCELDIKVQYQGGQEEEKMQVDTCRLNRVVFTNPGGRAEAPGAGGMAAGETGREEPGLPAEAGRRASLSRRPQGRRDAGRDGPASA